MSKVILNVASALLLAFIVVQLSVLFFAENQMAMVALTFVALVINGFFNARNAPAQDKQPAQRNRNNNPQRGGKRNQRDGRNNNTRRANNNRNNDNRNSDRQKPAAKAADKPKAQNKERDAKPKGEQKSAGGKREDGTVKWFNRSKGFGFIIRANGEEVFVHQRNIDSGGKGRGNLQDGQAVSFVVADSDRGPQAEQVQAAG